MSFYPQTLICAWLAALLSLPAVVQAAADAPAQDADGDSMDPRTRVVDLSQVTDLSDLIKGIADKRVIFVGESHDRFEDHLNQLAVIDGLHAMDKPLAIGVEFFQQPFQAHLDAFIAGEIEESELLKRTEYFDRWRFDYRLYRPILQYAREHGIPIVALNLEREITDKAGDGGIEGLSDEERARIPSDIDRDDADYRRRVQAVFDFHPKKEEANFEHFLDVQLLWDEGMAARAAEWLEAHPDYTMVVLAGAGHVEYGMGIPKRLTRRLPVDTAIVMSGVGRDMSPTMADYLLFPRRIDLTARGLLGVMLDLESEGDGVRVQGFADNSGAEKVGIEEDDRIIRIGGTPVGSYADIRIAMLDAKPGDKLSVEVQRDRVIGDDQILSFEVELH